MKSLSVKLSLFIVILFTSGCACFKQNNVKLTQFPPPPKYAKQSEKLVLSYDKKTDTYVITDKALENFLLDKVFLDEILMWRRENNIR